MKKIIVLFIFTLIIFSSAYAVDTTLIKKYFIEESTGHNFAKKKPAHAFKRTRETVSIALLQ